MVDHPEAEQRKGRTGEKDPSVLFPGYQLFIHLHECQDKTDVLLSTQPIVSLLNPSVLAVSNNLLLVPLSIPLCSTRLSSTARPCAIYWSIEFSLSCRNVCSRREKSSRAVGPVYEDALGAKGDSKSGDAGAFRRIVVVCEVEA